LIMAKVIRTMVAMLGMMITEFYVAEFCIHMDPVLISDGAGGILRLALVLAFYEIRGKS
jgi:hypothetical protein